LPAVTIVFRATVKVLLYFSCSLDRYLTAYTGFILYKAAWESESNLS